MIFSAVAGEVSGDMLGASVIRALCEYQVFQEYIGIGGRLMQAQGFHALASSEALTVRGIWDVLPRLPQLLQLRRNLAQQLIRKRIDFFLGIDSPDFNLGLEKLLKKAKIPTAHLISPTIWAWRPERINMIEKSTDLMLCVFPFELKYYAERKVKAVYVGHPLADQIPLEISSLAKSKARQNLLKNPNDSRSILALLPGSTEGEIKRHAAIILEAGRRLYKKYHFLLFIPAVNARIRDQLQQLCRQMQIEVEVKLIDSHEILQVADYAIVASGTATLECALYRVPMVIVYKLNVFDAWYIRRKYLLPYVGLPNILANKSIVPELLQENMTVDNIVDAMSEWVESVYRVQDYHEYCLGIYKELRQNSAKRIATTIKQFIEQM